MKYELDFLKRLASFVSMEHSSYNTKRIPYTLPSPPTCPVLVEDVQPGQFLLWDNDKQAMINKYLPTTKDKT